MHLGVVADYWWIILLGMAIAVAGFVLIAGRGAEGGPDQRIKVGWNRWRALSQKAGDFQARVILTVFYFTFAAPFGLGRTYTGDPLRLKPGKGPRRWLARETRDRTLDDARRQY